MRFLWRQFDITTLARWRGVVFCLAMASGGIVASAAADLMQAKVYQSDKNATPVAEYFVSEKLDGVRARWDGTHLISRNGKRFAAPAWFVAGFPTTQVLDGELWTARGEFERIVSIVADKTPSDGWQAVRFWIFDLPQAGSSFAVRVEKMRALVATTASPYLQMVEQKTLADEAVLMHEFDRIVAAGGEGLMLHKKTATYQSGRSDDLLKLKPYTDAEATVIGYKDGQGKYAGQVGSLQVQMDDGKVFYVGSGLSDAQRQNPPPIGSVITYRHQGFTKNGIPRFPVFIRIRPPLTLPTQ